MILNEACNILGLSLPYSLRELKKAYYKEALKHHPDKNAHKECSTQKFQKVLEAYEFLSAYIDDGDNTEQDISYDGILRNFIYYATNNNSPNIESAIHMIATKCSTFSKKILTSLDKKTLHKIYDYLTMYSDIIDVNQELLTLLNKLVKRNVENDVRYILNPTIYDLCDDVIYKLEIESNNENKMYYVPLWHEEIEFDEETHSNIVKCIPDLPKHMYIDYNNNVNVNITLHLDGILNRDFIDVSIADKVFKIPTKKLYIKPLQTYLFKEKGISKINNNNIYECKYKGDIIVNISIQE